MFAFLSLLISDALKFRIPAVPVERESASAKLRANIRAGLRHDVDASSEQIFLLFARPLSRLRYSKTQEFRAKPSDSRQSCVNFGVLNALSFPALFGDRCIMA
jgi:hypothetical protein